MVETEIHKRQKTKNYTMLAAIVGFIVLVFVVTILRMS